jgi:DNA-directed RNA polymerase subunit RPC12/RpoP
VSDPDIDGVFGDPPLRLRVLVFDIETAPRLAYTWGVWKQDVAPVQLASESFMLSWAAKWEDEHKVHSDVLTSDEALEEGDGRIVQSLADMVRAADVVVAHNGDRFDLPVLNTRLIALKLEPVGKVVSVDTLKIAKRSFRFTYNRLGYLADFLGHDSKSPMTMMDWIRAIKGDDKALRKMDRYCRRDVRVLEKVWHDLRQYAEGLPRMVDAVREMQHACPHCGHHGLMPDGWHRTKASNFARYKCSRCGKQCRSRSAARGTKMKFHPL